MPGCTRVEFFPAPLFVFAAQCHQVLFRTDINCGGINGRSDKDRFLEVVAVDEIEFPAGFDDREQSKVGNQVKVIVCRYRGSAVLARTSQTFPIQLIALLGINCRE